jgi:hypothetical protein
MKPTQCSESCVCDQVNGNYVPVVHICSKNTKQPMRYLTRHNRQYNSTSFRFSPLPNVHVDSHHKPGAYYKTSMPLTLVILQRIQTVVNVKSAVIILPKIGDGRVVPKDFLVIRDPHNKLNNPGKWLTSNMFFFSPRCTDILLYIVYILTK